MCHIGGLKLMMKTFDHAVRLGVVACSTVSNNDKLITQIIQQFGFEMGPSRSGDSGWLGEAGVPKRAINPLKKGSVTVLALISMDGCEVGQISWLVQ